MNLPVGFNEALEIIVERLSDLPHPWAITGSLGMLLQGMDLEPHDIDLQSDDAGVKAMQERLDDYVVIPVAPRESERIRSLFGTLEIAGVKVEIMGAMAKRQPGGAWNPPTDMHAVIRWATWKSHTLPVLDLEYEYLSYLEMGRGEKAQKMRDFLDQRLSGQG